jgi:hypothetical protein
MTGACKILRVADPRLIVWATETLPRERMLCHLMHRVFAAPDPVRPDPGTTHGTTACCMAQSAAAARVDTPILP